MTVEIDKLPCKKFPLYLIPAGYKRIEDENGYSIIVQNDSVTGAPDDLPDINEGE